MLQAHINVREKSEFFLQGQIHPDCNSLISLTRSIDRIIRQKVSEMKLEFGRVNIASFGDGKSFHISNDSSTPNLAREFANDPSVNIISTDLAPDKVVDGNLIAGFFTNLDQGKFSVFINIVISDIDSDTAEYLNTFKKEDGRLVLPANNFAMNIIYSRAKDMGFFYESRFDLNLKKTVVIFPLVYSSYEDQVFNLKRKGLENINNPSLEKENSHLIYLRHFDPNLCVPNTNKLLELLVPGGTLIINVDRRETVIIEK